METPPESHDTEPMLTEEAEEAPVQFSDFDVDPRMIEVLKRQDITVPTPVQREAIPVALTGKDLVAIAQTGTGKTLGFTLPSLTRLARNETTERNAMLVLVPTRELCTQVYKVVYDLGKALGMHTTSIYGGVGFDTQTRDLKQGTPIIVATPGRLLDHMERMRLRFDDLQVLVLDEADRMLDMGFLPDLNRILQRLPKERQTLMFSATFPDEIARLASSMMHEPERVQVGAISKPVDKVRQFIYPVNPEDKTSLLCQIIEEHDMTSCLVFLRTKIRTETLAATLKRRGHEVAQIHGDRSQQLRQKALDGFRSGKYKFLVATDVAARGLDIDSVSHVINYDVPLSADDYVHRIGRTARAEAEGDAITFVCPAEFQALSAIERAVGGHIPQVKWEKAPRVISMFDPEVKRRKKQNRRGGRMLRRR